MTLSQRAIEAALKAYRDEARDGTFANRICMEAALTAALTVDGVCLVPSLARFLAWAMKEGPFDGCDLAGDSVQDKAEELGLIIKVAYDPARHGNRIEAWEGCDWFEVAPEVAAMLAAANNGEERR